MTSERPTPQSVQQQVENLSRTQLALHGLDAAEVDAAWKAVAGRFPWHIGVAPSVPLLRESDSRRLTPFIRACAQAMADGFTETLRLALALQAEVAIAQRRRPGV
ncbi:MAG TPA: hypothetical protein VKS60_21970 [Stellaceae bacterium]|nr:hypothetical protein [Stellaceae bacterium]